MDVLFVTEDQVRMMLIQWKKFDRFMLLPGRGLNRRKKNVACQSFLEEENIESLRFNSLTGGCRDIVFRLGDFFVARSLGEILNLVPLGPVLLAKEHIFGKTKRHELRIIGSWRRKNILSSIPSS